jgi:hypothetical protein
MKTNADRLTKWVQRKNEKLTAIRSEVEKLAQITVTVEAAIQRYGDVVFMPHFAAQTSLPYTDPGPIDVWSRENGIACLSVQPWLEVRKGSDGGRRVINHGVPSGSVPRLILAYLGWWVVTRGSREVQIGGHFSSFMRLLGYVPKWGKGETNEIVASQLEKLATCRISYSEDPDPNRRHKIKAMMSNFTDMSLVKRVENFWLPSWREGQNELWTPVLTLTEDAFESFKSDCVPTNLQTLRRLKKSPLKLDIYTWLSPRLFRIKPGTTTDVSYDLLALQFGSRFNDPREFQKSFDAALIDVCREYTSANVEFINKGIRLRHSRPHVDPTKELKILTD